MVRREPTTGDEDGAAGAGAVDEKRAQNSAWRMGSALAVPTTELNESQTSS